MRREWEEYLQKMEWNDLVKEKSKEKEDSSEDGDNARVAVVDINIEIT